jgi:hypothetical protein
MKDRFTRWLCPSIQRGDIVFRGLKTPLDKATYGLAILSRRGPARELDIPTGREEELQRAIRSMHCPACGMMIHQITENEPVVIRLNAVPAPEPGAKNAVIAALEQQLAISHSNQQLDLTRWDLESLHASLMLRLPLLATL